MRFVQEATNARTDGDGEPSAEKARKEMIQRAENASKTPRRIDRARTRNLPDHPPVEQASANQHAPPVANTSAGLDARKRAQADSPKRVAARRS
jgi:hypothetical protein